ncbi:MAG: NAD-dependent succinate-semialdehyde dehydrogenase [Desulfobulbaceae bacterium]|nr:NAD-dependent succinate-semialdehyde dehydrogenase [Desulfobulbaceae bacterium]
MSAVHHDNLLLRLKRPELLRATLGVQKQDEERMPVYDPATGAELCTVPRLAAEEAAAMVEEAHRSWRIWKRSGAGDRAALLHRYADLVAANQEDLAVIMTAEQGKPLSEARGEVAHGARYVRWYAEEAKRLYGEVQPQEEGDRRFFTLKEALGVCAAITPWNFPCSTVLRKVAPALAAGCTVLVKPASHTPLSALALACLAKDAGFPPGVLQVLCGPSAEIGPVLTRHPLVRGLSFTGSTEVGKKLMQASAAMVKRLSLELGGHAPFIVFADADLDAAVQGLLACKFRNSGQTCVAANRLLVQETVLDAFSVRLLQTVQQLRIGSGFVAGTDLGPLINEAAVCKVEGHIDDALALGAELACGGRRLGGSGHFFTPTILMQATATMRIMQEESFGPVLPVQAFRDENEAIAMANDTPYGLAAYFYSRDINRIIKVAESLHFGMVGINTGRMSSEAAPFGGVKESGFGREGSRHGIDEFLELKSVCLGGLERR